MIPKRNGHPASIAFTAVTWHHEELLHFQPATTVETEGPRDVCVLREVPPLNHEHGGPPYGLQSGPNFSKLPPTLPDVNLRILDEADYSVVAELGSESVRMQPKCTP
jgi:hypothetical protein